MKVLFLILSMTIFPLSSCGSQLVTPNKTYPKSTQVDWFEVMVRGVKEFEKYRSKPYFCSGGKRTIGYGCTISSIVNKGYISERDADKQLRKTLRKYEQTVKETVDVDLTDYQLAALTSFTYNLGPSGLRELVDQENRLNSGNYGSVKKFMPLYRKSGGVVRKGLIKRRKWEVSLFEGTAAIQK